MHKYKYVEASMRAVSCYRTNYTIKNLKIRIYYDNYNQGEPQFTVQKNWALNQKKEVYIF